MLFIKCRQKHFVKLLSDENIKHFQILKLCYRVLSGMCGRCGYSSFPPYTTESCKKSNFAKKGTSFLEALIVLVFTDNSVKSHLYDMHAKHGKILVGPGITKLNCPYLATPSNNIK